MTANSELTVLYLRGVPRGLVREAKAAAAREGRTLASLTCGALASALGAEAPEDPTAELRREMSWYQKHRARLFARFQGEFVAIYRRAVIDHDHDFSALAERVFEKLGPRPIFMPHLVRQAPIARVRSPRLVRS